MFCLTVPRDKPSLSLPLVNGCAEQLQLALGGLPPPHRNPTPSPLHSSRAAWFLLHTISPLCPPPTPTHQRLHLPTGLLRGLQPAISPLR